MDWDTIWKWIPRVLIVLAVVSALVFAWYEFRGDVKTISTKTQDIETGITGVVAGVTDVGKKVDESAESINESLDDVTASTDNVYAILQGVTIDPGFGVPGEAARMSDTGGQPMFCFGTYNPEEFVAAVVDSQLPFLPCGTVLRVQNLEAVNEGGNYAETRVTVADKFPEDDQNADRLILLSPIAAEQMGLSTERGIVRVLVTVYAPPPEPER